MNVKMITVGMFQTNCYLADCQETREAIIIDPGFDEACEAKEVLRLINENKWKLKLIINTHGHPDHTCGNGTIREEFNVPVLIHKNDVYLLGEAGKRIANSFGFKNSSPPADVLLEDGDTINFGKATLKVIHTPGHSSGSISLLDNGKVFTGDTLFAGSIGRTDFPGSSELEMRHSLKKLKNLPDHLEVYPGHGPVTTIGCEKRNNPFL